MRWHLKFVLPFVLIGATSCGDQNGVAPTPSGPRSNAERTIDEGSGFERLRSAALSGDALAAATLQLQYAKSDPAQELFWVQIAAENGHAPSQYNLAFELWNHGLAPEQDKIRARFWLKRAAENGDTLAAKTIESLEEGRDW